MNGTALVDHLGWVLLHSLWQFAAIALVAGVMAAALRNRSAAMRYGMYVGAMACMVVVPAVTWCALIATAETQAEIVPPTVSVMDSGVEKTPEVPVVAEPVSVAPSVAPAVVIPPQSSQADVAITSFMPTVEERTWSEVITDAVRPWMAWMVAAWSLGVVLCSLRPLIGWLTLRRLRTIGVVAATDDIVAMLQRVSERLGLRTVVTVLQSTLCQTPMVLGYFRPIVLLPVSLLTNIPPAQLEAILAHELAHIRRHDFVINLLQTLIETLCFYHPAVWWVSRRIRIEREHCCDDVVIAAFNNRADYGRALLAVEELRGVRPQLALGATDGSLLSRIRRIVGLRSDLPASSPWSLVGVIAGTLTTVIVLSLLTTHEPVNADDDTASSTEAIADADPAEDEDQLPIATWNVGQSLEFVGITKNTAAVKEGWKPNGTPIGDLPNWKSTIVLHGGNSSSSYTEGKLTHKPDDDAVDFLFRFRGLKAQPSLTFDMPTRGLSYSHLPVQDPYEIRISAWKRDPKTMPPGVGFTTPDNQVTVGLTDEPWGRWVKITPEGDVPEPIQPNEMYASTYCLIDVRGTVPSDRGPLGKAIVIREPSGNKDPEDPWHRFAFEFRAIDTEGKDHWALMWESQSDGESKFVTARYGVSNSFPKDKTLSHYEYRLRPYRHWVTFENVSLEPGKSSNVKVATRTVTFDPAEKLAEHFASALRAQQLPFLNDAKTAVLSGELLDTLRQRPPRGASEEQLQKLRDEFTQRGAEPVDAMQRLRFYYAGLKLPATTQEQWKTLTDGITQFVQREFDPREKDAVYLAFRDRFDTLQLFIAAFLMTSNITPEQADALQDQRAWMKQEIFKLPESPKFRLTHGGEIDKLQALIDDPLNPFFNRPLSDSEFARVKELYAQNMSRNQSETRLNMASSQLTSALVDVRANPLQEAWPVKTYGWNRSNTRWSLNARAQVGNSSLHLGRQISGSLYADIATMTFVNDSPPAKLEDHAAWLQQQRKGDLAYDAKADAFVAVRGAKLAVLKATSWYAADRVPLADLKTLIEREGVDSVPMATFVKPSTIGDNRIRDLRDNPPSLVVQTQEGKIAVVRLFTFGPVIQSHLRPLPPNPPLHDGDAVPAQLKVLDANGNPAKFNHVVTAHVGYPPKAWRSWVGWRDKNGLVSLETLPAGKHWLFAAPEFEQRTIFPLTQPVGKPLVEQRLRSSEMWTQRDYEFKPRFDPNEKNGGDIVVSIINKFDKPLTVTEADLSLHVGETATYRVVSPQWADEKFSSIEIAAKETGELRLNWKAWVEKGFWSTRDSETISEPTLPPNEPGRIYVRVNLGNSGALPIAVTDWALILAANENVSKPDAAVTIAADLPQIVSGSPTVVGRVESVDGKPVVGATITAVRISPTIRTEGRLSAVTNADGEFRLALNEVTGRKSQWWLYAIKNDDGGTVRESLSIPAGETPTEQPTIVIRPGRTISGVVVDHARGQPIAGAEVYSSQGQLVSTDRQGHFQLRGVPKGVERLAIKAKSWATTFVDADVSERATAEVEVRMSPGGTVQGRVVDENGQPVAGCEIHRPHGSRLFSVALAEQADAEGHFRYDGIPLNTLQFPLLVSKAGYQDLSSEMFTARGTTSSGTISHREMILRVRKRDGHYSLPPMRAVLGGDSTRPNGAIRGRVVDARGNPVEKFTIGHLDVQQPGLSSGSHAYELRSFVAKDGRFIMGQLDADKAYQLRIWAHGIGQSEVGPILAKTNASLTETDDVECRLAMPQPLKFRVIDAETQQPLPNVAVGQASRERIQRDFEWNYSLNNSRLEWTDAAGIVTFADLPVRQAPVFVDHPGYGRRHLDWRNIKSDGNEPLAIELSKEAKLHLRLTNLDGINPVAIYAAIRTADNDRIEQSLIGTSPPHAIQFARLTPGQATVAIFNGESIEPWKPQVRREIELKPGDNTLDIELPARVAPAEKPTEKAAKTPAGVSLLDTLVQPPTITVQDPDAPNQPDGGIDSITLLKNQKKRVKFPFRLPRVEGFDEKVVRIRAITPNTLELQSVDVGWTVFCVKDEQGRDFAVEVEVPELNEAAPNTDESIQLRIRKHPFGDRVIRIVDDPAEATIFAGLRYEIEMPWPMADVKTSDATILQTNPVSPRRIGVTGSKPGQATLTARSDDIAKTRDESRTVHLEVVPLTRERFEKLFAKQADSKKESSLDQPRGTLKGRFVYDGEAPIPRDLFPDLSKLNADSELPRDNEGRIFGIAMGYQLYLKQGIRPKTTDPSLLVDKTGGIANVVIWITSKDIPYFPKDHYLTPASIVVHEGHFHPRISCVQIGQTLEIENQDAVPANFHAEFQDNPSVNLVVPSKQDTSIEFERAEVAPRSYRSDLTTWANGFIMVRPNTYVAVSQPDGTFTMPDLPPGEWEFRVWHERNGYVTHWPMGKFTQKITTGDNHLGNIRLKPELFAERTK